MQSDCVARKSETISKFKRHYIISHEIRKKLGIDEHETNIGLYIRKLMRNLEK